MTRNFWMSTMAGMMVAACFAAPASAANLLVNPGFEIPPVPFPAGPPEYFGAPGWTDFGGGTFTISSVVSTPNSGNQLLKMFGGTSGVFQEFPASPGQTWDGGAWVRNDPLDPMAGGQVAAVNIEWFNAANSQISFISNGDTTAATNNDWILRPISGVAPAGTTKARLVLITGNFLPGNPGGAPKYDDAFFGQREAIPEPASMVIAGIAMIGGLATLRRRRSA